ncbi:hypothetical protein M3Y98_00181700 [Aphelenchoides besseyi]|nr:hypothetical protein M3Y98_00181700 [Aphelenchoides besseyi]KAI6200122.1 hypothetical protein M3Y96_00699600 [Aphelenchoides besseyi]
MDATYQQTRVLMERVRSALGRLELTTNESEAQPYFQEVFQQLNEIGENCKRFDELIAKEPPTKKRQSKIRADQLKHDYKCVNASLNALQTRLTNKWRHAAEREELLHQRFRPNETHLNMEDAELQMNDKLKQSHSAIDELIAHGTSVLDSIRSQGSNLTGIRQRVLDIGQTLGLSGTTLRMIERRVSEDWIIFVIGCIFVLIFMFCFYRFWMG